MRTLLCLLILGVFPALAHARTTNVCALLARNPSWHDHLLKAYDQWRVTPGTLLAVLDQESRFNAYARGANAGGANPSRNFGYAQANLRTWNWFLRDTGKTSGLRTDFATSLDFIGWHFATMERRINAPRTNVTAHYLAYKMGEGGYRRGASAPVRARANRLAAHARLLDQQLPNCGL